MAKTPKFANAKVFAWVDKWNRICTPDKIVVVKGTKKEHLAICEMMVKKGQFIKLNPKTRPDCYLARSHEVRMRATWRASRAARSSAPRRRSTRVPQTTGWTPTR